MPADMAMTMQRLTPHALVSQRVKMQIYICQELSRAHSAAGEQTMCLEPPVCTRIFQALVPLELVKRSAIT